MALRNAGVAAAGMETPLLLIGPVVAIGFLVLLPFFAGEGEKSWKRRPIAVVACC